MFLPVLGYVDPGVGATLMQLSVAGVAGVAAIVKLRWHSIKRVFRKGEETPAETDQRDDIPVE